MKNISEKGYIILSSSLSTINLIAGLAAFYALGKSRSGIIVAVQTFMDKINTYEIFILAFAILFAAGFASIITILIAKKASNIISKIPKFFLHHFPVFRFFLILFWQSFLR